MQTCIYCRAWVKLVEVLLSTSLLGVKPTEEVRLKQLFSFLSIYWRSRRSLAQFPKRGRNNNFASRFWQIDEHSRNKFAGDSAF